MGLKLMAEVGLDGSGFERGLHKIGHAATHNLKNLVVGAFGVYSIHQAIHKTVETAEELVTASRRMGIAVEQLQVLKHAAKENFVEFGKLAGAFERLNVAREKALGSGPTAAKALAAFARLGVTQDQLRSQTAAQLFMGPMRQKVIGSGQQEVIKPLRDLFGKGGGEFIPLLQTNFEELQHKMEHLGSIMTTETAVKVKLLADEFGLLGNIIVAQTAPALVAFTEGLISALGKLAGASAAAGSATMDIRPEELQTARIKALILPGSIFHSLANFINRAGANRADAAGSFNNVAGDWEKRLEAVKKEIADMAERLKHPSTDIVPPPAAEEKKKKALKLETSDSLVRVGNFLGQSKDAISRLQERQVDLLQQIADNTEPRSFMEEDAGYPLT